MSTSRIARKPVAIPTGIDVKLKDQALSIKGPKGQLSVDIHPFVKVTVGDGQIQIGLNAATGRTITGASTKLYRAIAGTTRANIFNIVHGVTQGFERKLVLVGVGYRAQAKGKVLSLSLGYSHPTDYAVPEGITVETPTQTEIIVKGIDKHLVGQVADEIRRFRKPEPYKGKGARYSDEVVEIKETKKK